MARAGAMLWLLLVLGAVGCDSASAHTRRGPNVVLIVVDTLRADRLTQFGYERQTSSALEEFASHATRFEQCFAPSPWTTPSTATILSGLHPVRHGSVHHGSALAEGVSSLAESLSDHGWRTAGFSYNHNISRTARFDQGFDSFLDFGGRSTAYPDISTMVDEANRWLADEVDGPFLLYLQPMNSHGPYLVPEDGRDELLGRVPRMGFTYYGNPMHAIMKRGATERRRDVSEGMLQSLGEQYDTAIRHTTDNLSRVLEQLRERGLYDDSLIILTSDHGEELFDHGGFSHGYSLHREVLHVPLLVKLPRQREPRVVSRPVSLEDIYPTVHELLDVPLPYEVDGESLARCLTRDDEAAAERSLVFHVDWKKRCVARSIQRGPYKLVHVERDYAGREDQVQLFDLRSDPRETEDLSDQLPDVVRRLEAQLASELGERRAAGFGEAPNVLDQMDADALRKLGYL